MPADSEGSSFITKEKNQKKELILQIKKRQKTPQRNNIERLRRLSSKTILSLVLVNRRQTTKATRTQQRKSTRETNFFRRKTFEK